MGAKATRGTSRWDTCSCGCGEAFISFEYTNGTRSRYRKGHAPKAMAPSGKVECACGCGQWFRPHAYNTRQRENSVSRYIKGHSGKHTLKATRERQTCDGTKILALLEKRGIDPAVIGKQMGLVKPSNLRQDLKRRISKEKAAYILSQIGGPPAPVPPALKKRIPSEATLRKREYRAKKRAERSG